MTIWQAIINDIVAKQELERKKKELADLQANNEYIKNSSAKRNEQKKQQQDQVKTAQTSKDSGQPMVATTGQKESSLPKGETLGLTPQHVAVLRSILGA